MMTLRDTLGCDTVKKVYTWLGLNGVVYTFHDFKRQDVGADTLASWLKHVPLATLLNCKDTMWRVLSDVDKTGVGDEADATALMRASPLLAKWPVLVHSKNVSVGFSSGQYAAPF